MKLQLSICAKELPSAAKYRAVVRHKGEVVGQTEDSSETKSPSWSNLVHTNDVDLDDAEMEVAIYDAANDANAVASTSFKVGDVFKSPNKQAIAKFTSEADDEGAKICVRATEQRNGRLQLVLAAQDLPDTDWGLGLLRKKQHTDPIYELFSYTGRKVCRSNRVNDDLNPTWEERNFELDALCGGIMSAPLRITVLDKDRGGSTEFLGEVIMSVNDIIESASSQAMIGLKKGGKSTQGSLIVKAAALVPQQHISRDDTKALEAATESLKKLEEIMADAEKKKQAAEEAQEKADAAKKQSETLQKTADEAAAKQAQAQEDLVQADTAAKKVAEEAEKGDVSGSLQIQLAAKDLPDTDGGIRLRNKTDPYFEMFRTAGPPIHKSNVVDDDLNPTWEVATVDLIDLCKGNLDEPFLTIIADKDGGSKKQYLGVIKKSVNDLIKAKPSDALVPDNQPKGAHGKVFVKQAELLDFKDLKKEAAACQEACEKAKTALKDATAAYKSVQKDAEEAREAAALSIEAAELAKDAAEAANLAVEMAQIKLS